MSSAVISTSAALSRPFLFDADIEPQIGSTGVYVGTAAPGSPVERSSTASRRHLVQSTLIDKKFPSSSVTPASQLTIRPTPEMASSGIPELDALTGGLPRGCLTEICGTASSGRTSVLLAALAAATRRGEYCAIMDASDSLDPQSAADAGVDLDRLLWVRCGDSSPRMHRDTGKNSAHEKKLWEKEKIDSNSSNPEHRLEQVLRATDLLLESGGFGLIILDLADVPSQTSRRIPMTTWFRFRRSVEHKPTVLLAIEQEAIAGSCSSLLLKLGVLGTRYSVPSSNASLVQAPPDMGPTHVQLLSGLEINIDLIRSRLERKPAHSIRFESKAAWAR